MPGEAGLVVVGARRPAVVLAEREIQPNQSSR